MLGSLGASVFVSSSGSSGMTSRETGLAALVVLLEESLLAGDLGTAVVLGRDEAVGVRLLVGLPAVVREAVAGRLAGADVVAPPMVVRLDLSAMGSGLGVRDVADGPTADEREEGRRFSSAVALSASLLFLAGVLRVADVDGAGRVGGLLMVLPDARDDKVGRVREGEGVLREDVVVLMREEVVVLFFASSLFVGGFAPPIVGFLLSISAVATLLFLHPSNCHSARCGSDGGSFKMRCCTRDASRGFRCACCLLNGMVRMVDGVCGGGGGMGEGSTTNDVSILNV